VFENLLFQQQIVSTLKKEIEDGTLPQSLLFYGDPYSGKLTAAIELSRVLNCEISGEWGCQCKSCKQSMTLQNPYTLITGSRDCLQEIIQSGELLLTEKSRAAQYIFIRNIRKLLKRFSEDLWEKDDNKFKKNLSSLNKIEEALYEIDPNSNLPVDNKLKSIIKKITDESCKVFNELPKGNIPISQIRNIAHWVRRSVTGNKKVVILEHAELMQESSRNALLKILEEPPAETYFILISEKKSTIMPTILSRVRCYPFKNRSKDEQIQILNKLYNTESKFDSIKDYFFSFSDFHDHKLNKIVEDYLEQCFIEKSSFSNSLSDKIDAVYFNIFLEILSNELRTSFFNNDTNRLDLVKLEKINEKIRDKVIRQLHYNQNSMLLLETLFYEMKRILNA